MTQDRIQIPTHATNIGQRQRIYRLSVGIAALVAGVALTVLLVLSGSPRIVRVALIGVYLPGMLGVLQYREKTCVYLSTRGQRNMDTGPEPITDIAEFTQLIRQTRSIFFRSVLFGVILTVLSLLAPVAL
jgi:hypothetical protein